MLNNRHISHEPIWSLLVGFSLQAHNLQSLQNDFSILEINTGGKRSHIKLCCQVSYCNKETNPLDLILCFTMKTLNDMMIICPEDKECLLGSTLFPAGPLPDLSILQQVRVPVMGNKQCGRSYLGSNKSITDKMICVRPEGKVACQVTFMAVLFIINLFNIFYSIRRTQRYL